MVEDQLTIYKEKETALWTFQKGLRLKNLKYGCESFTSKIKIRNLNSTEGLAKRLSKEKKFIKNFAGIGGLENLKIVTHNSPVNQIRGNCRSWFYVQRFKLNKKELGDFFNYLTTYLKEHK